jgi:hypothetical protein
LLLDLNFPARAGEASARSIASSFFASFIRSCNEDSAAFFVGADDADCFPDAAFLIACLDPFLRALALLLALVDDLAFTRFQAELYFNETQGSQ